MASTDIDSLEQELRLELEKFEHIFDDDATSAQSGGANVRRTSLNEMELAQAEGEKEVLQDRLQSMLARSEEHEKQVADMQDKLITLTMQNSELRKENGILRVTIDAKGTNGDIARNAGTGDAKCSVPSNLNELELKLGETRAKLARTQQAHEDQILAREMLEKEIANERILRMHAEKERDAYSAAYEASLKHFERWSQKKQLQKSVPSIAK